MAMAMEVGNKCILKAASFPDLGPHPPHHDVSTVPLNIFDKVAGNVHFPVLMAYRNMPSNEALIDSLSKAIQPYPHLTGRFSMDPHHHNRPSFVLNNAGMSLVETKIPLRLTDNTLLEDIPYHKNLYPSVTPDTEEMFQIQFNRYACGGLVLGFTFCHLLADGISIAQFIQSWARVSRGAGMGPAPFHDRHSLFVPNDPPQVKFDHLEVQSNGVSSLPKPSKGVESIVIQFPGEFIAQLKKQVPFRCTTFECLLAHLWRKTTQIRGIPEDEITRVRVAVNGRTRLRPVVPPEYFGNLVLWALPKARAGELAREGLSGAVGIVRKAVARMDNEYFRSAIDFGAVLESKEGLDQDEDSSASLQMGNEEDWENMLYPDLEVDSWLGFRTNEIDFGQGPPCAIVPPSLPIEGVMAFISSAKGKGGVDAFLTLRKEHVHDFKRMCMTLE